jgi:hypothetical protein
MSSYPNEILFHLWLGFMLILSGGVLYGIRRLTRRQRLVRGDRP